MARAGLNAATVADRAGIRRGSFYRRFNGTASFDVEEIIAVSRVLEVRPSYFLDAVPA